MFFIFLFPLVLLWVFNSHQRRNFTQFSFFLSIYLNETVHCFHLCAVIVVNVFSLCFSVVRFSFIFIGNIVQFTFIHSHINRRFVVFSSLLDVLVFNGNVEKTVFLVAWLFNGFRCFFIVRIFIHFGVLSNDGYCNVDAPPTIRFNKTVE